MVSSGGDMSSSEAAPAFSSSFSSSAAGASAAASASAAAGALFTAAGGAFLGIDVANMPMVDGYLLWDGIDRAKRVSE